ncbi:MAG: hypothetical protein ABI574_13300 [Burkholderiales bacterium]
MGTSTDGQICFGITFEEGHEFPWNKVDEYAEIEDWWAYDVHGLKHSVELFDGAGNYLNGREPSKEEKRRYFDEIRAFKDAHPLPVTLVNYCSGDCPMYVLAAPGSVRKASRGNPTEFDPSALCVAAEEVEALTRFCQEHGLEGEPKWLLTSYWG